MRASLLVAVLASSACASHRAELAVVPGVTLQYHPRAQADTIVFQREVRRDGHDSSTGTRTVVLTAITSHRPALLQVEQRFPGRGGEIVDTAVAELATLRAVSHQSHQPTRTMRFVFADAAEGSVAVHTAAGDSTVAVHQPLGGPLFDSNVIDLVVASLPLRPGFSEELPFFFYERGGRVLMRVTVRERATVAFAQLGMRDVWVLNVAVPGAPATMWIDAKAHVPLRVRYDLPTVSFSDERVTPVI
ncbi:MAG TPA: hypothetical protein VIV83_10090 [Gemmatimonadales bacterium]|jgi:hypothetical protein